MEVGGEFFFLQFVKDCVSGVSWRRVVVTDGSARLVLFYDFKGMSWKIWVIVCGGK